MSYFNLKYAPLQGVIRDIENNHKNNAVSLWTSKEEQEITSESNPKDNILNLSSEEYWVSEDDVSNQQWLTLELTDRWISLTGVEFHSVEDRYPRSFHIDADVDSGWVEIYSQNDSDVLKKGSLAISIQEKITTRKFRFMNAGPSAGSDYTNRFRIRAVDIYGAVIPCFGKCGTKPPYRTIPKIFQTCIHSRYFFSFFMFTSIILL